MNTPSISVVIPVRNGARYLPETLASINAQSIQPSEILVVDDGSTDNTSQIAQTDASIRYLRQHTAGAGAARNRGAAAATGELLAFIDADDLWLQNKLTLQLAVLQQNPSIDMVFAHIQEFASPELSAAEIAGVLPRLAPLVAPSVITLLMRRSAFLKTGGFPTELPLGEFIAWYQYVVQAGLHPFVIPQVLARRRLHTTNQGRHNRIHLSTFALIAKRALDRKRHLQSNAKA